MKVPRRPSNKIMQRRALNAAADAGRCAARMHRVRTAFCILLFSAPSSLAESTAVMQCDEMETCCHAGNAASRSSDWTSLYAVVSTSRGCDDGWVAEVYSDRVSFLLSNRWPLLGDLAQIGESHPWFLEFVLKRLDETVSGDDMQRIREHTKRECPRAHGKLCKQIRKRAS
jgi:hypothetical protein